MRGVIKAAIVAGVLGVLWAPVQARAEGYISPFAGVHFGNDDIENTFVWGGDAGYMGAGVFGIELDFGYAAQAQSGADLAAQERCRPAQRLFGFAARLGIAERGVVHARQLQIGRHRDARQRDEADAGIVNRTATEQLADLLPNLIADAIGTV